MFRKREKAVSSRDPGMAKSPELLPLHRPKEAPPASSGRGEVVEASPALPRAGYLPLPPALASGPDMTALLRALSRRWLLAGFLGILLAGGGGGGPPVFCSPCFTAFTLTT